MQTLLRTLTQNLMIPSRMSGKRYLPDSPYMAGFETRTAADHYDWDGLRRGGNPERPFVVFQVTLDGRGIYQEAGGVAQEMSAGDAFAAIVPGTNRYYLPSDSSQWTFFYVLIRHPYVVQRIAERQRAAGTAVLKVSENSAVVVRAASFLLQAFPDRWSEEEALLSFMLAFDRHVALSQETEAAITDRERVLEDTRRFVLERLNRPVDVAELAAARAMSRSRFSHYFRGVTGSSPAAFMGRVRLEEVSRRLMQSDAGLTRIAAEAGFADANHLCKAFRRQFGVNPGAFRRQMR